MILSKSVYEDLLEKIDRANQVLKALSEQSRQREGTLQRQQTWKRLL